MERLEAAMVVHVAYCRSSKGKYFYVATLMQTKPYNLGHHNDNNIYSLVDSKVCWELGSDGT